MSIGDRLREERVRIELSQTAFGEALGVCKATVMKWESNIHYPPADVLGKAAEIGLDVRYVVSGVPQDKAILRGHAALISVCEKIYRDKAKKSHGLTDLDVDEIMAIYMRRGGWPLLVEGMWAGRITPLEAANAIKEWRKENGNV